MRKHIALGILGLITLAVLVPAVVAYDDDEREERDKERGDFEERRNHREGRDADNKDHDGGDNDADDGGNETDDDDDSDRKHREGRDKHRESRGPQHMEFNENFTLRLAGDGDGLVNRSYTFTLQGDGKARERTSDGNVTKIEGAGILRIVVTAANGTVIQDRDVPVRFKATDLDKDGGGSWSIKSEAHRWFFWPRLHLHGSMTQVDGDSWSLEGKGNAGFNKSRDNPALRLKLSDISGSLSLERPA